MTAMIAPTVLTASTVSTALIAPYALVVLES
jgi:hypothetical protein